MFNREIFRQLPAEDIARYCVEGFLPFKKAKDEAFRWGYVSSVHRRDDGAAYMVVQTQFEPEPVEVRVMVKADDYVLDFPETGIYTDKTTGMAVWLRRKPTRTTLKLLSASTAVISPLFGIRARGMTARDFGFVWNPQRVGGLFATSRAGSLGKALEQASAPNVLCVALSKSFAVSRPLAGENYGIWYLGREIGWAKNEKEVVVKDPAFLQEAKDEFQNNNIEVILNEHP